LPIVHLSSAAVYGQFLYASADEKHPFNPISPYGFSKLLGEGRTEDNGRCIFPATIFRPTITYDRRGGDVVGSFIENALSNRPLHRTIVEFIRVEFIREIPCMSRTL